MFLDSFNHDISSTSPPVCVFDALGAKVVFRCSKAGLLHEEMRGALARVEVSVSAGG